LWFLRDFITYIGSDQRVHWLPWGKTRVELHVKAMFKMEDYYHFPKLSIFCVSNFAEAATLLHFQAAGVGDKSQFVQACPIELFSLFQLSLERRTTPSCCHATDKEATLLK